MINCFFKVVAASNGFACYMRGLTISPHLLKMRSIGHLDAE